MDTLKKHETWGSGGRASHRLCQYVNTQSVFGSVCVYFCSEVSGSASIQHLSFEEVLKDVWGEKDVFFP